MVGETLHYVLKHVVFEFYKVIFNLSLIALPPVRHY